MTQEEFFRDDICAWEGGLSLDPADQGNWFAGEGGAPVLVGSCYGVTGAALARFRQCRTVTPADMAALSRDEAVRVGERLFYREPGFDRLPWDPLVASAVDFGWGAGPREAVLQMQQMIGAVRDGCLGEKTAAAYHRFVEAHGLSAAASNWRGRRDAFYHQIVARRPGNARFLHGWLRRSASFLPGTSWWRRFTAAPAAAA